MNDLIPMTPAPARFRLISSDTVPLTKALVDEMQALPPSPTERECSHKRKQFLRDRLNAGLFHPPHWVKAVVEGVTYRANGQHSSRMLAEANGSFPEGLKAHVDVFECDGMDGLALLFRQFDDRQSGRTPADVAGAYQGLEHDLADVPRFIGKLAVEAICWHRRNVKKQESTPNGDDRYVVFHEQQEHAFIKWVGDIFDGKYPTLMKPPIFAAIYATYLSDVDAADDFWREIITGGREYEDEYPTTVLADWYQRHHDHEFDVKPRQLYQGAIYAWNALRDGKVQIRDIKSDIKKHLMQVH